MSCVFVEESFGLRRLEQVSKGVTAGRIDEEKHTSCAGRRFRPRQDAQIPIKEFTLAFRGLVRGMGSKEGWRLLEASLVQHVKHLCKIVQTPTSASRCHIPPGALARVHERAF